MTASVAYILKVDDDTCFRKSKDKTINTIPKEKSKYNCRILLRIHPVYYNNIDYYPQVFLQQCWQTPFINKKLVYDALEFADTEPGSESEDKEFNENFVL